MIDATNTIYKELNISEHQIKNGQVIDAQEHLEKLKSKYGLNEQHYLMCQSNVSVDKKVTDNSV